MKNYYLFRWFLIWYLPLFAQAQNNGIYPGFDDHPRGMKAARIMFYNVENLFDYSHDSLKSDQEFLPESGRHWDKHKYWTKQRNIAKVITAVGGWEMPAIVGLAEVENRHVLLNLVHNTQLKNTKYQIIHYESPDRRGIDVALLYRREKFRPVFDSAISIRFPFDTASRTRDLLYVKGILLGVDTIHLIVSHWPSKYGGAFVTIPKRLYVARQIRKICDSIIQINPRAKVLIMGDLNDNPQEKSLEEGLVAVYPDTNSREMLFNMMLPLQKAGVGTHFYKGSTGAEWSILDQFVVSRGLYNAKDGLVIKDRQAHIFKAQFLLEKDQNGRYIPNRSFIGMKYHGGYSDHLPIFIDLEVLKR